VPGRAEHPLLAVIGHIDEIALLVSHISDKGLLHVVRSGGWDPQVLVGQRVRIQTAGGEVPGVIGKKAIHVMEAEERKKVSEIKSLWIDIGAKDGEQNTLLSLGHVHRVLGRVELAEASYEQALEIARTTGDVVGQLSALTCLGHGHRLRGRYERAADNYRYVLGCAERIGSRNWEFEAHQGLGRSSYAMGDAERAAEHHRQALELARSLDQLDDQARAHDGLAHAYCRLGCHEPARRHWQGALDLLAMLGREYTEDEETDAETIRVHLQALDDAQE
jgi:tetratricopeptide (TPR) repeat protein